MGDIKNHANDLATTIENRFAGLDVRVLLSGEAILNLKERVEALEQTPTPEPTPSPYPPTPDPDPTPDPPPIIEPPNIGDWPDYEAIIGMSGVNGDWTDRTNEEWTDVRAYEVLRNVRCKRLRIHPGGRAENCTANYADINGGTLHACDISGSADAVNFRGAATITANYLHDLAHGPTTHCDGIQAQVWMPEKPDNFLIARNVIVNDGIETSCILLGTGTGKGVVQENLLRHKSIGLYPHSTQLRVVRNRFHQLDGGRAYLAHHGSGGPEATITAADGNVDHITGAPVFWS